MQDLPEMIRALWENEAALDYLGGRGLLPETIEVAQLGYCADGVFPDSIAIPYFDARGRWRATRFRTLRPNGQRYYQPRGERLHLYNVAATDAPVVFVTEGEFDALILRQHGLAAVGVPGAQAFRPAWRLLFRDADEVVVLGDGDEAGRQFTSRVAAQLREVTAVTAVELPEGYDVTDLYLADPDRLWELLGS